MGCSPEVPGAVLAALKEAEVYPDSRGAALVKAIAEHLGQGELEQNIILGNGSDEIIGMAASAYIEPGSNAIIARPTFSQYAYAVRLFGGDIQFIDLDEGRHNLKAMAAAVNQKTRIVFLCNPNNPTGTYFSQTELLAFLASIPSRVLVVLDEAYCEFATAKDYPQSIPLLDQYPNLLILRTFSKLHGLAALRLGYGLASPEIIELFLRIKQPFNVNSLAMAAGQAAIKDRNFQQRTLEMNRQGMAYLTDQLDQLGYDYYPSQSNFICIHTDHSADEIYQHMLGYGITIRSLRSFGMEQAIRVTVGPQKALEAFITGLKELKHA
ncbi:MAG: histidinol-phosphate transaminase [Spirochaetaceae bacterium]|nr:MAG: histidinol-phosphate transaminase [Spirochaetaceae bacterium]